MSPSLKHTHTFGCPVYALHSSLAANKYIPKWDASARLYVYFGPLPRHAQSVTLVLNLSTGLVSPQFHVIFDDFFEMTRFNRTEALLPSAWQHLSGFDFEARFTKSRQQKITKQQLVPPTQPVPANQMENNGEFNDGPDVVDFPANEAEDLTFKPVVTSP